MTIDMHKEIFAIEEDIRAGYLSFKQIAAKYGVPFYHVNNIWEMLCEIEMEEN